MIQHQLINVDSTSFQRPSNFQIRPYFNVVSTLRSDVDSTLKCPLGYIHLLQDKYSFIQMLLLSRKALFLQECYSQCYSLRIDKSKNVRTTPTPLKQCHTAFFSTAYTQELHCLYTGSDGFSDNAIEIYLQY